MAQKRILKRDASSGRVSEGATTDTYFSADPSVSTDLTTKNYADTNLAGQGITPGSSAGQIPIFNGTAWVPGDPYVQGVFPPGTNVNTANGGSPPAPLNPVLIGAEDPNDLLQNLSVSYFGSPAETALNVYVVNSTSSTVSQGNQGTIAQSWYTEITDGTNVIGVSAHPLYVQGTVSANCTQTTSPWVVTGTDADNAANSTTKLPTLPARANTSAPSWTDGHEVPLSVDLAGNLRVSFSASGTTLVANSGTSSTSAASWTSSTLVNTAVTVVNGTFSYNALLITLNLAPTGTLTGGAIVVQGSNDNTNWLTLEWLLEGGFPPSVLSSTYTFKNPGLYDTLLYNIAGWQYVRVLLEQAITGTGTVTVGYALQSVDGLPITSPVIVEQGDDVTWLAATHPYNNPVNPAGTFNSSSALNTAFQLSDESLPAGAYVVVQLTQTSTITGGAVTFEAQMDGGTTYVTLPAYNPVTWTQANNGVYTLQANTTVRFAFATAGWQSLRARLSTVVTGTGTVSIATSPIAQAAPFVASQTQDGSGNAISSTAGSLNVDVTNTVTVSGTVTSNQGGAPWTVKPDGTVWALTGTSANVDVTNTVAVSGTVTANIGTTNGLALDSSVNGLLVAQGSTTSGQSGPLVQTATTSSAPTYTTAKTNPLSTDTSGNLRTSVNNTVTTASDMSGTVPGTAPSDTSIVGGIYNSSAPTPTNGQTLPLQLDSAGRVIVAVGAGSAGNAAASATGSAVPADADYIGLNVGGTLRGWTGVNPSGTAYAGQCDIASVIGHTAVAAANGVLQVGIVGNGAATLDVAQGGATAATNALQVAGVFNTSLPTLTNSQGGAIQLDASGRQIVVVQGTASVKPDGSVWTLTGTSANVDVTNTVTVSGTVTANIGTTNGLALDSSVNGILVAQGSTTSGQSGPLVQTATTTSAPTYTTAKTNPLSTDTSGNLRTSVNNTVTVSGTGTFTTQDKADMTGTTPGTAPSNTMIVGGKFNSSPPAPTNGQTLPLQLDQVGNLSITRANEQNFTTFASWTSSTSLNTAVTVSGQGYGTISVALVQGSTITGGAVTFEVTDGISGDWYSIDVYSINGGNAVTAYTLVASTNVAYVLAPSGWFQFRVRLSTVISGTGTVTAYVTQSVPTVSLPVLGNIFVSGTELAAVSNYGTAPSAVSALGVNAYVTNAGSIGGGTQYADNAASGATPTGTLSMGWDSTNSKVRALKVDASQNLEVAVNAALPAGTNTIGKVDILGNSGATMDVAQGGATAATNALQVAGVYNPIPITLTTGQASALQVNQYGSLLISPGPSTGASLSVTASQNFVTGNDAVSNNDLSVLTGSTLTALAVGGYAYNGSTWDRLRTVGAGDAASTGILAVGGYGYNGSTFDRLRTAGIGSNVAATGILADQPYGKFMAPFPSGSLVTTTNDYGQVQIDSMGRVQTSLVDSLQPFTIQKANAVSSGSVTSLNASFASNNTVGNTIVVVAASGSNSAMSVTDTLGNTYTEATNVSNGSTLQVAIFYATNCLGGANTNVTLACGSSSAWVEIYEVNGLEILVNQLGQAVSGESQTATGTGSSASASTSSINPLLPNMYAFTALGVGTANVTFSAFSNYTKDASGNTGGTQSGLFSAAAFSQPLSGLQPTSFAATLSGSEPWAACTVFFKTTAVTVEGSVTIQGQGNVATVKAASTQSAATDTSLVVQINPEQPNLTTPLNVQSAHVVGVVYDSSGNQHAVTTVNFSGITATTTLVSAVGGQSVRVLAAKYSVNGTVNVQFQSHTTTTNNTGLDYFVANQGSNLSWNPGFHMSTTSGEALDISLSASVATSGYVTYAQY